MSEQRPRGPMPPMPPSFGPQGLEDPDEQSPRAKMLRYVDSAFTLLAFVALSLMWLYPEHWIGRALGVVSIVGLLFFTIRKIAHMARWVPPVPLEEAPPPPPGTPRGRRLSEPPDDSTSE